MLTRGAHLPIILNQAPRFDLLISYHLLHNNERERERERGSDGVVFDGIAAGADEDLGRREPVVDERVPASINQQPQRLRMDLVQAYPQQLLRLLPSLPPRPDP